VGDKLEPPPIVTELLDVAKYPGKPSYPLAPEFPLVLHHCGYPNVEFGHSAQNIWNVYSHLEQQREDLVLAEARIRNCQSSLSESSVALDDLTSFTLTRLKLRQRKSGDSDYQSVNEVQHPFGETKTVLWSEALAWLKESYDLVPEPQGAKYSYHSPLLKRAKGTTYEEKVAALKHSSKRLQRYEDNVINTFNKYSTNSRLLPEQRISMLGVRLRPLPATAATMSTAPVNSTSTDSPSEDATLEPDGTQIASTTSLQRPLSQTMPIATQTKSLVHDFATPLQFLEALSLSHEHNNNRFMVVKYYASYCKICQRASINYKKIAIEQQQTQARQNDDEHKHQIDFYQLDAGRLPGDTLKTLSVTKFPFCQIFFRGDCVASFGLSTGAAAHLFGQRVRDTLDMCLARSEDEWEAFRIDFAPQIKDNLSKRDAVQEHLMQNCDDC
jgi:hypothetical protein